MPGGADTEESRMWEEDFSRWAPRSSAAGCLTSATRTGGENPPFRVPVVVNTHRPEPPIEKLGGTTYIFVTEGRAALALSQRRGVEVIQGTGGGVEVTGAGFARLVATGCYRSAPLRT